MNRKSSGEVNWNHMPAKDSEKIDAGPKYSRFSESIRHAAPGALQCSMFCGGKTCKYENPSKFKSKEMAIDGLYSSWITDNILATARPSSEIIRTYKVIDQFKRNGIKSIINLQHPDEHASCGYGLQESGFSYEPEEFMQAEIFYYNFGWNDYGVRSLESILDMVKVMSFALQNGKAAIHCHAGLGRTGVLISCYLVFAKRIGAEEAIHLMRMNRPRAVQTRGQIECVKSFYKFLEHRWIVFPSCHSDSKKFTLRHYLNRQKHLLHGMEARELKHLPKIVCVTCSKLLELASVKPEDTNMKWSLSVDSKRTFSEPEESEPPEDREDLHENTARPNLKNNPYVVEVEFVHSDNINRSSSIEDIIDTDSRLVASTSVLYDRSRACSEPDISHNAQKIAGTIGPSPRATGSSFHGIRLKPLNANNSHQPGVQDENVISSETKHLPSLDSHEEETKSDEEMKENNGDVDKLGKDCSIKKDVNSSFHEDRNLIAKALATNACVDPGIQNRTEKLKRKVNSSNAGWDEVKIESDPLVLSRLLWSWLEDLEEPVISQADIDCLSEQQDPIAAVKKLNKGEKGTLECLMTTVCELGPLPEQLEERVLRRISMVLTHDRQLPLTSPRASLDKMLPTSLDIDNDQNSPQGDLDGSAFDSNEHFTSVVSSPSYRLLIFLRTLLRTIKGQCEGDP